jgi:hypothetical protein
MSSFSQRHGYSGQAKEITVREDAPDCIRVVALETASSLRLSPSTMRDLVCLVLRTRPDLGNWSDGNIRREVEYLVYGCDWFRVYDIIEAIYAALVTSTRRENAEKFAAEINTVFVEEGIGWQLVNGQIVTRGDEGFQRAVNMAATRLQDTHRPTAAGHIQSAIKALSERPQANTAGAVSHATNAVECLLNDITGEVMTLAKYLDKHPRLFHPALKKALDGLYGYASDAGARHGKEGTVPAFAEAQFAVSTCAATCTLLTASNPKSGQEETKRTVQRP